MGRFGCCKVGLRGIEREKFKLCVLCKDGSTLINKRVIMDSFSKESEEFSLYEVGGGYAGSRIYFCDEPKLLF